MRVVVILLACATWLPAQDDAAAHSRRARDLAAREEWEGAGREYSEALRLAPDDQKTRLEFARTLIQLKEFEPALSAANIILHVEPSSQGAQVVRAAALTGMGKPGVARLFLLDLLKEYPESADAYYELGKACLADQRFDEAITAFRTAWKIRPSDSQPLDGIAEVWFRRKEPAKALDAVRQEADRAPDRSDLQQLLGKAALGNRQFDLAAAALRRALTNAPQHRRLELLRNIAVAEEGRGKIEEGIAALRQACELAPQNGPLLAQFGAMLFNSGRMDEATSAYEAAIAVDPDNGVTLNNYAFMLAETGGDINKALDLAQRARARLPNLPEITDTVGWVYLKAGKLESALDVFDNLVERYSGNAGYRYHLAAALASKGRKAEALKQARQALELKLAEGDEKRIRALIARLE